jgi:hypothetical protein
MRAANNAARLILAEQSQPPILAEQSQLRILAEQSQLWFWQNKANG